VLCQQSRYGRMKSSRSKPNLSGDETRAVVEERKGKCYIYLYSEPLQCSDRLYLSMVLYAVRFFIILSQYDKHT
jgi:hypothetical protein